MSAELARSAPAVVRSASLDRGPHRSFLADVVIDYGPRDILGRLFLQTDTALRQKDVFVSFSDYDELLAVNRANRDSWRPLLPIFDPSVSGLEERNGLVIIGRNANGKPVFAQSCRLYELGSSLLKDEIENLGIFYSDPARHALPGEAMPCSAPIAGRTTGDVVFNGALWLHPDYRGLGLPWETMNLSRGLLFTRWQPELIFSFMAPELVRRGLADVARMHVDWEVTMINTPIKRDDTINAALVWLSAEEQIQHFRDYVLGRSALRDTQVDHGIVEGSTETKFAR